MNKTVLAFTVLLTGASAAALATLPSTADASQASSAFGDLGAQPAAMQAGLCGMTPSKVLGIRDHYGLELDLSVVAGALQTPFNCGAYGDLCDFFSPNDARDYACGVWNALDQRRPVADIVVTAYDHILDGETCVPNQAVCADTCFARGVASCDGVFVDDVCQSLAVCGIPQLDDVRAFEFLTPGWN